MPVNHRIAKAAFFDIDNTLLDEKSMFSFMKFFMEKWRCRKDGAESFERFYDRLLRKGGGSRSDLNRHYYRELSGYSIFELSSAANAWFNDLYLTRGKRIWVAEAVALLKDLEEAGWAPVAVSGSAKVIIDPVLCALSIDYCLATDLELIGHVCSGEICGEQVLGEGKALLMRRFATNEGISLADCWACGDHISDLPMLNVVGYPCAVSGDRDLERLANDKGWKMVLSNEDSVDRRLVHV